MKIKYIKTAPQGKVGDIVELDKFFANALICLGYAEEYKQETKKRTVKKTTAK